MNKVVFHIIIKRSLRKNKIFSKRKQTRQLLKMMIKYNKYNIIIVLFFKIYIFRVVLYIYICIHMYYIYLYWIFCFYIEFRWFGFWDCVSLGYLLQVLIISNHFEIYIAHGVFRFFTHIFFNINEMKSL